MKLDQACKKILEDREVSTSTQKSICDNLKMISVDLKEANITKLLNDYKRVEEYLNNKPGRGTEGLAINSFKKYYTAFKSASTVIGCTKEAIEFYDKKMMEYAKQSGKKNDESLVPEKFTEGQLPPWSDVASLPDKFTGDEQYSREHLIVSLYVLQPPRRLEYRTLFYLKQKPTEEPKPRHRLEEGDKDANGVPFNYIYPDGDSYQCVIRDYKTVRRAGFGVFKVKWSKELGDIVSGYIKKAKIKDGTALFPVKSGQNKGFPTSPSGFSKQFSEAFAVHYKKYQIGEQNIRDMYVDSNVKGKRLAVKDMKRIAWLMGHTFETQQTSYGKNQSPHQSEASGSGSNAEASGSAPIQTQEIEPEPIEDIEETPEEPQEQEEEQEEPKEPEVIELVEKTTKEDVLATIKKYYELKIKLMEKKLAMFENL